MRRYLIFLSLITSVLFSHTAPANDLAVIGQLAKGGAPGLALALIDQSQPDASKNIAGWLFFEQQRIQILQEWRDWDAIYKRLSLLPEQAPAPLKQWAGLQRADALLKLKRPAEALGELRQLIWQPWAPYKPSDLELYRRLIIRAWLLDGKLGDAWKGISRYEQDYGSGNEVWKLLQARVFLRTDRPRDALGALEGLDGQEAHALRLLAQLNSESIPPAQVIDSARRALASDQLEAQDQRRLQWIIAKASVQAEQVAAGIIAAEEALLLSAAQDQDESLFVTSTDALWEAYRALGRDEGNRLQLLLGDPLGWYLAAEEALKKGNSVAARALASVIIHTAEQGEERAGAFELFERSFGGDKRAEERGSRLLWALFTQSDDYQDSEDIPPHIRYRLIDLALGQSDIEQAAWLMQGLEQAPEGADAFEWNLRRARVTVLSGHASDGAAILKQALSLQEALDEENVDRSVQVIFDLQTVSAHEAASELLLVLLKRPLSVDLQRELYFWLADSWKALDNTPRAAAYYLRSATLLDGFGFDPWGQTARFNAAEVLVKGGILDDAQRLFEQLLKLTSEENRRAVIRNKLQSTLR